AEELDRAISFKRTLGVIAVIGNDAVAFAALASRLRMIDVVGHADDGVSLLLLPEVDRDGAHQIAEAALAGAPSLRAGLAMCPADACDPDTILLVARAAARRAAPGIVADAAQAATKIELDTRHVLVA